MAILAHHTQFLFRQHVTLNQTVPNHRLRGIWCHPHSVGELGYLNCQEGELLQEIRREISLDLQQLSVLNHTTEAGDCNQADSLRFLEAHAQREPCTPPMSAVPYVGQSRSRHGKVIVSSGTTDDLLLEHRGWASSSFLLSRLGGGQ